MNNVDRSSIAVVWNENDYSVAPTTNQVLLIMDTNGGRTTSKSGKFYTASRLPSRWKRDAGYPA
jgi:hypothetical protein